MFRIQTDIYYDKRDDYTINKAINYSLMFGQANWYTARMINVN